MAILNKRIPCSVSKTLTNFEYYIKRDLTNNPEKLVGCGIFMRHHNCYFDMNKSGV